MKIMIFLHKRVKLMIIQLKLQSYQLNNKEKGSIVYHF